VLIGLTAILIIAILAVFVIANSKQVSAAPANGEYRECWKKCHQSLIRCLNNCGGSMGCVDGCYSEYMSCEMGCWSVGADSLSHA